MAKRKVETSVENSKSKTQVAKTRTRQGEIDLPFLIIVMVLLVMGIVMMFSASYASATLIDGVEGTFYVKRQLGMAGVGLVGMFVLSFWDYHKYMKQWVVISAFGVALVLTILTLTPIGVEHNGADRWLKIGIEFQPSEVLKLAVIMLFSFFIARNHKIMNKFSTGVLPYIFVLGMIAGILMLQPHLSATVLICSIGIIIVFVGGAKVWHLVIMGILGVVGLVGAVIYKSIEEGFSYFADRIQSWLEPFSDTQDATWQTCQSLIAIGSGGLFGLGLGNSRQKYLYLPETKNDFVFAIVCEELGFIGAMFVILVFALFIFRGFYIASKSPDKLGMLLCVGLVVQIGLQAFLNIAVVTNSIPNTGISLPFFSYGGTALILQLWQMGIVLNISRHSLLEA